MTVMVVSFFAGEYHGEMSGLENLCDLQARVTTGKPISPLLVAWHMIDEGVGKRYATPALVGNAATVFICQRDEELDVAPLFRESDVQLLRMDLVVKDGYVYASIVRPDYPREDAEPVRVDMDEDVTTIVRKLLEFLVDPNERT
jgi:hypothetical protein